MQAENPDPNLFIDAKEIEDFDRPIFERANVLLVRADEQEYDAADPFPVPEPQTVSIQKTRPAWIRLLKNTAASSGISKREGLAKAECERFEKGASNTLYEPLCMKITPLQTPYLFKAPSDVEIKSIDVIANEWAVSTPQFDTTKVEVGILMRQAADRAYGIKKGDRERLHQYIERRVIGNDSWTTTIGDNPALASLCTALLQRAYEIVKIQSDQGKVWRSIETVKGIRRGALTIAAAYNEVVIRNNFFPVAEAQ